MGDETASSLGEERELTSAIYRSSLEEIVRIFGRDFAPVLKAHQRVEALTGEKNLIGRQNLLEAFGHLGILFAEAPNLSRDDQMKQVAYLADHLRRVMMESFEQEVYVSLAAMWDQDNQRSVGRLYDAYAAPQIKKGALLQHITPDDLEERLDQIQKDVLEARKRKVADGDFSEWIAAANELEGAAEELKKLRREVGAAVDAAVANRTAKRRWLISLGVGVGLALIFNVVLKII